MGDREAQLNGVLDSTARLYGDLQGFVGGATPESRARRLDDRGQFAARGGIGLESFVRGAGRWTGFGSSSGS
jgi:hypothetical protein